MPHRCVAAGCSNSPGKRVSLFKFPRDPRLFEIWVKQVRRTRQNWTPTRSSVLCSDHFEAASFEIAPVLKAALGFKVQHRRVLKPNAVPSIFIRSVAVVPVSRYPKRTRSTAVGKRSRKRLKRLSKDSRTSTVSKASPLYPVAISSTQTTESAKYTDISSGNNKEECPKLQKTTRHPNETDGMRESFEEVTQKIMERFHGNISTVQDISIVINSLAEFCCISTEWMDMDEKASGSLDEYSDGIDKESAKTSPLEMHIEIPTEKIPADCGDSWKTCMEREGDLQHRQIRSNGKKCGHKQVRPFCQQRGGDKKLNKCNACGKKFSNQTNLKNHLLRHIAGKSQNPECGEMFQTGEVSSQHGLIKGVSDFSEAPSPSSDHPSQGRSTRWEVYVKKGKRFLTEYVNDLFQYTSHSGPVQDGPPALSVPKK
ncbi:zinc finger protein 37-like isoform X3 [Ptychodera flava]|uniref:zinc finger protein 37-like isoform X3 n=1 Tax=Ptychodera flava TaxID=63121 RepID=UPI00396A776C